MKKPIFYTHLFLLALLLVSAPSAVSHAATSVWTGAENNNWNNPDNWTNGVPGPNDIAVFNNGMNEVVTFAVDVTVERIRIIDNTHVTFRTRTPANNTITLSSTDVALNVQAGSSLTLDNNSGQGIIGIAFAPNTNTVNIGGELTLTNTGGGSSYDATNSDTRVSGTLTNEGGAITSTTANLRFAAGGTYVHAIDGGTIPAAIWNDASTALITGITNTAPAGVSQSFGSFIWNNTGQVADIVFNDNIDVDGDFSLLSTGSASLILANAGIGSIVISGDYIQSGGNFILGDVAGIGALLITGDFLLSGGMLTIAGGILNSSISVGGDFTIDNGTLVVTDDVGEGAIGLNGDFIMNGGILTETSATSVGNITFNGGSPQAFIKTGGTISGDINFTISNGAIVDFDTYVLDGSIGDFTLSAGGTIITANNDGLYSDGSLGSIQVDGTILFNSNATYEFQGATTGVFATSPLLPLPLPTDYAIVADLIVNAPGGLTLLIPVTVSNTATFTAGIVMSTDTEPLIFLDDAVHFGASDASFVDGPVIKVGNDAFIFPVGDPASGYAPIGISAPLLVTDVFQAEYFWATPPNNTSVTPPLERVSELEYWTLEVLNGTPSVAVTLNWDIDSQVSDPATLLVARFDGAAWVSEGNGGTTGDAVEGSIVTAGPIAVFGNFTLGTSDAAQNPLPVELVEFNARLDGRRVVIDWRTASETDNDYFVVERSPNLREITEVARVKGAGNSPVGAGYQVTDDNPLAGLGHYRLRQVDLDGQVHYSDWRSVTFDAGLAQIVIYPNPGRSTDFQLSIEGVKQARLRMTVTNSAGQMVYDGFLNTESGRRTYRLDQLSQLPAGAYHLSLWDGDRQIFQQQLIVTD